MRILIILISLVTIFSSTSIQANNVKNNIIENNIILDDTNAVLSDVDIKVAKMHARIDSLNNILEAKKTDKDYANKITEIEKIIIQLSEFTDQITMISESQLSDGDKLMELVFVDYSLDGIEDDIKELDKTEDVVIVTNDTNTDANTDTNTNTNIETNTDINTDTNTDINTDANTNTNISSSSPISRVNPNNGELLQLSKGYYVVVMAFGVYDNATRLFNTLKADGFSAGIIKNATRDLYYVYSHYSTDESEAKGHRSTQSSKYQGAWVFPF